VQASPKTLKAALGVEARKRSKNEKSASSNSKGKTDEKNEIFGSSRTVEHMVIIMKKPKSVDQ